MSKMDELGNKIARQLDQGVADLDDNVVRRLRLAREKALSHHAAHQHAFGFAWASHTHHRDHGRRTRWFAQHRLGLSILALVIGLLAIAYWQDNQPPDEVAEVDAALLSGDLPIHAYTDDGFKAWLRKSGSEN
jgi:hypothetical protein